MEVSSAIGPSRPLLSIDDQRDRATDGAPRAPEADGKSPRDRVTISREAQARASAAGKLTPDQQRQLTSLRQRDAHVRQHEAAHQAAGGALTGGASYSYQVGPDGRSYAVGGEVPVRLQSGRTPDETIANARQARRAALAPSDPSPQDLAVAAAATQLELSAVRRKSLLAAQAYGKGAKAGKQGEAERPEAASSGASERSEEDRQPVAGTRAAA